MWDGETRLFSHKTHIGEGQSYVNEGINPLYSAIALIGLLEERSADARGQLLVGKTLDALHSEHAFRPGAALGGSLIWAASLAGDRRTRDVLARVTNVVSPRRVSSMELGLLLSGLIKCHEHAPYLRDSVVGALPGVRDELLRRFNRSGHLFSDGRQRVSIRQGRLASFASQAYPIHALAELARCVEGKVRAECALAAERLVAEQGSQGQWWWQYSTATGRAVEGYPVFSVHQDGMAFMALGNLQNLGHGSYEEPLWLGLRWVLGENELDEPLVHRGPEIIFRCIQRRGSSPDRNSGMSKRSRGRAVLASLHLAPAMGGRAKQSELEVLRECRSYHLGWLLYASRIAGSWSASPPVSRGDRTS